MSRFQISILLLALSYVLSVPSRAQVIFKDITSEAGISWKHDNGMSPKRYLPETMIGGSAFIDYNNDGWIDIYLVNGSSSDFYRPENPTSNALYRNNRDGTFSDVTQEAGVPGRGFGVGVAAGDYDSDGWQDLFLTGVRSGILYRNLGDGTFREVTKEAGVDAPGWGASAMFVDFDNDSDLDLWVCGYVIWEPDLNFKCGGGETPRYCIPTLFEGWPSRLFRNLGNGRFEDVSQQMGIADPRSKGLGVVAADLNNDGWLDIFQSNDTTENFLFMNRKSESFEEIGLISGVAFSHDGKTRSGMGVDAQDYDDDGWVDLFVANIDHEDVSVYRNLGTESFEDIVGDTPALRHATRFMSTFGAKFFDFDNDGDHDIIVTNGHPDDQIDYHRGNIKYLEKPQLFENRDYQYHDISASAGPAFQKVYAGRGLSIGDIDNDGDSDLLFLNNGEPPALVLNDGGNCNKWLGLQLIGTKSNRDGIGTRISYTVNGRKRYHYVAAGSSYQSAHDHRIILGFSDQQEAGEVRLEWQLGTVDVLENPKLGEYHRVEEGSGLK